MQFTNGLGLTLHLDTYVYKVGMHRPTFGIAETSQPDLFGLLLLKLPYQTAPYRPSKSKLN